MGETLKGKMHDTYTLKVLLDVVDGNNSFQFFKTYQLRFIPFLNLLKVYFDMQGNEMEMDIFNMQNNSQ